MSSVLDELVMKLNSSECVESQARTEQGQRVQGPLLRRFAEVMVFEQSLRVWESGSVSRSVSSNSLRLHGL